MYITIISFSVKSQSLLPLQLLHRPLALYSYSPLSLTLVPDLDMADSPPKS